MITIHYASMHETSTHATLAEAYAEIRAVWPRAVFGGGLAWARAEDMRDDERDGLRAVARLSIGPKTGAP